jgi:uncharacterized membrane protein HdeD (DUF308 family)
MAVMSTSSPRWGLLLTQGIFAIIIGVLLLIAPRITVTVAVVFLGAWWLVMGIVSIVGIFTGYTRAHWGWALFGGILGIIAGILVLGHPIIAAVVVPTVLVLILACFGIIMGIVGIVSGAKGAGGGAIALGILSLIIGILLFIAPLISTFVLIILLGIFLVAGGIMATVGALQIRSGAKAAA